MIHVLVIPAWLPTFDMPHSGPFIPMQARAIMDHCPVRCGLIFREEGIRKGKQVVPNAIAGIDSVIVSGVPWPKLAAPLIRVWSKAYGRAFDTYVEQYGRPDILHAHSYIAGFAAHELSRMHGIPFVLTEHATSLLSGEVRLGQKGALSMMLADAARVIAVSTALGSELHAIHDRAIDIIPNMYDEKVFKLQSGRHDRNSFVTVGNLIPRKRVDLLLRAFALVLQKHPESRLTVVGSGSEADDLKSLATALGLADSVRFTGPLTQAEVSRQMAQAGAVVSASALETFGITLVEGMACGLPAVITPNQGAEDFMNEMVGITTPSDTVEDLAQGMLDTVRRDFDRPRIAEYARNNFSSPVIAERIYALYQEVIKQ